jgi:hypothetical protein
MNGKDLVDIARKIYEEHKAGISTAYGVNLEGFRIEEETFSVKDIDEVFSKSVSKSDPNYDEISTLCSQAVSYGKSIYQKSFLTFNGNKRIIHVRTDNIMDHSKMEFAEEERYQEISEISMILETAYGTIHEMCHEFPWENMDDECKKRYESGDIFRMRYGILIEAIVDTLAIDYWQKNQFKYLIERFPDKAASLQLIKHKSLSLDRQNSQDKNSSEYYTINKQMFLKVSKLYRKEGLDILRELLIIGTKKVLASLSNK